MNYEKIIKLVLKQVEEDGTWSCTIDAGNTDLDYQYGCVIGYTAKEATEKFWNNVAEKQFIQTKLK